MWSPVNNNFQLSFNPFAARFCPSKTSVKGSKQGGYEMKRTIVSMLCGVVLCVVMVPASGLAAARVKDPRINRRQENQKDRIQQGVKSGELTRQEKARLKAEQARIRANEKRAKADGKLTEKERKRLEKELNKSSRDIYKQKHDNQERK